MSETKPPPGRLPHYRLNIELPGLTGPGNEVAVEVFNPETDPPDRLAKALTHGRLYYIVGPWPPVESRPASGKDVPRCHYCGHVYPLGK
jgi:hypothetical protein